MESKGETNRTITKLPGFTAEASLFKSRVSFRSEARYKRHAIEKIVIPAQSLAPNEGEPITTCPCPCCMEIRDGAGHTRLVCC